MKIQKTPELHFEHVPKGLIHLDSSIPKLMTLFPRLFSRLFNVDIRYSLFCRPGYGRHIFEARWESQMNSLAVICVERTRLWQCIRSNYYQAKTVWTK